MISANDTLHICFVHSKTQKKKSQSKCAAFLAQRKTHTQKQSYPHKMHFYFATELFYEYDQTLNKVLRCISIVKNNTLEVENKDAGKRMNLFLKLKINTPEQTGP